MKNKELETYYNNFLDLFITPGWQQFLEDLGTTVDQLNDIRSIDGIQDLAYRQGQLETVTTFLNFEASVRETIRALEEDENDL